MLSAKEEAEAALMREIDNFIDELQETYDDDLVESALSRKAEQELRNNDGERLRRARELLNEADLPVAQ